MKRLAIRSAFGVLVATALSSGCGGTDASTAIVRNASDVRIVVERVDEIEGGEYVLTGTIETASPAGGSAGIAEAGQTLSLTPYFPGGSPDPGNPVHSRLMMLRNVPIGSAVSCRISLDSKGGWRILSVE